MSGKAGEPTRNEVDLDPRQEEVLRAIIRQHVHSGEPVGSSSVARQTRLGLSSASIRHVMAELESMGLLAQPHTSAGRVPTDGAFRIFVDRLMPKPRVPAAQAAEIARALARARGEVDDLLAEASRILSQHSQQVGLVVAPELARLVVERVEFVRLDARRAVAIVVARSGVVHSRILDLSEPLDAAELERAGRLLSSEFGGLTLPEMRDRLRRRLGEERAAYDRLLSRSLELGRLAVAIDDPEAQLFVEGVSNLVGLPEFADQDLLRATFRALEEKRTLVDLLGRVLEGGGVQVVIGRENPLAELARCSLVASTYGSEGRRFGTVGVVGPTRMPYPRAVALVEYLAGVLTKLLSSPPD